jgi:methionyl-tRNA synthetase
LLMKIRKIVATAALPYANGPIHVGHLVEYLQADFWTRFQKMRGHDCAYICADDTHGTPIMLQARELGITPEELIAKTHLDHSRDFADFEVLFDIYSSTNTDENRILAEEFYGCLKSAGHIGSKAVKQLYCEHDKMFLPDRFVKGTCPKCGAIDQYGDSCDKCGATYNPDELKNPKCSICTNPPVHRSSEHLFVQLDHFREFLKKWVPEHTPREVSNKLFEWLNAELKDWDISRDNPYFGFRIPGYTDKYFYVWLDAPIGYISSTQIWCKQTGRNFDELWRSDQTEIYHFIGKDIINFHCLFWPAMLSTTKYRLPNQVFVHGHLTVNGEKMSKSKGTSIKARTYLEHLDPMYLRYYYASKLTSSLNDFDLSADDFANRVNSDLVGKITNLGSRGAQMLSKKIDGKLGSIEFKDDTKGRDLLNHLRSKSELIAKFYEDREFSSAIEGIRELADACNKYFDETAPWNLIKTDIEATRSVLTTTLNAFRILAIYLTPVLPKYSLKVSHLFGEAGYKWDDLHTNLSSGLKIQDYVHLASRIEPQVFADMISASQPAVGVGGVVVVSDKKSKGALSAMLNATIASGVLEPKAAVTPGKMSGQSGAKQIAPLVTKQVDGGHPTITSEIEIDDFSKIDLRVVRIVKAEAIPDADKLLRLQVDLGGGVTKQIFAGIKSAYDPAALEGRLTVIVANLKPRKMKFGMSEGMVLAAGAGGKELFILSPDDGAKPGDKVK